MLRTENPYACGGGATISSCVSPHISVSISRRAGRDSIEKANKYPKQKFLFNF
jgi:hypothetical protein